MSMPSIPSRPRTNESGGGGGGLVSSRVKAFANAAVNSPPSGKPPILPAKPKQALQAIRQPSPNLPSARNIQQMAHNFEAFQQNSSAIQENKVNFRSNSFTQLDKPDYPQLAKSFPKLPPPLPKTAVVRPPTAPTVDAVKNSSSDFSVKDMKSKFEHAAAALSGDRKISQPSSTPTGRPSQRTRPVSEFFPSATPASDGDFNNNNAAKVKSIRAELESKLTLWTPNSGPPHPPHAAHGTTGTYAGTEDDSTLVDYHAYQQPVIPRQEPPNIRNDPFPISSSYTDGFSTKPAGYGFADERPVLPTLSAKSKPPPRPPPCSLPSRRSQSSDMPRQRGGQQSNYGFGSGQYGETLSGTRPDFSRTPSPQEATALVAYDFHGEQSDELTCKRGDNLILKHDVDEDWYYAYNTRTSRTGIIPKGFVDVKVPLPTMRYANPNSDEDSGVESTTDGPRCYTLHDFVSNVGGDLTFLKGEVIKLVSRVNDEWLEGESHDGRRGIFPVNFVEIIEDLPTLSPAPRNIAFPNASKKTDSGVVTALYDFHGDNPGDLSFLAGAKISAKAKVNADWLYGVAMDSNQAGIFPTSFVDRVPSDLPLYDSL